MSVEGRKVEILGCDIGSKSLAFAILSNDKYIKSWLVEFPKEQNLYVLTHNAILEALRIWESVCEPTTEKIVVFESIPMRFGWARVLIEIVGVIKCVVARADITFDEISPTTIKKAILGIGNPPKKEKKQLMVDAINKKFGLAIESHDQADSIAIAFSAWLIEKE